MAVFKLFDAIFGTKAQFVILFPVRCEYRTTENAVNHGLAEHILSSICAYINISQEILPGKNKEENLSYVLGQCLVVKVAQESG